MSQNYTLEFKKKIVRLHEEEGRTYKSITAEYGVSKADSPFPKTDAEHIMKMKLAQYFYNKGFFFDKVHLKEDTELMISNRHYSENQFQWNDFNITIL